MKIGAILEKSQSKKLADIAKNDLTIGEKFARQALKNAGCFTISGKKGWHYEGDSAVLNESIYKYAPAKKINRRRTVNEKAEAVNNPTFQLSVKEEKKEIIKKVNKKENKEIENPIIKQNSKTPMKKVTYEIEEQLHDELKIKAIREKRNVSEIVNEIIKRGL